MTGSTVRGGAYWANGDLYEGQFKEGRFSGKGTYTYADKRTASPASTVQEMEGEEGMNEDMDQLPTLVESFTGFWEDNKLDGHGTIRFTDGEVQVSTFKNDQEVAVGARWSSGKRETAWKVVAGKPTKMLTLDEAAMIARRVGEAVPEVEYQEVEEIYIDQEEEEEFPPGPAEEEEEVDEEERRRLEREAKKAAIVAKAEEARKAQAAAKAEEREGGGASGEGGEEARECGVGREGGGGCRWLRRRPPREGGEGSCGGGGGA